MVHSFIESEREETHVAAIEQMGISVKTVLRRPSPPRDLLFAKPLEHFEYCSEVMCAQVRETLDKQQIDVLQAEYLQMAQHVPRYAPVFKILTEHEIQFANAYETFKRPASLPRKIGRFYDWMAQFNYEVRLCRRFDRVVCMTEADLETLEKYVDSRRLRAVPIGVDCEYFRPEEYVEQASGPPRVLFVGNYRHLPNRETVYHFAEDILPRIHQTLPLTEFDVVGGNVHLLDHRRLEHSGRVNLIGLVEDVRPYYQRADVFVAPIHSGNGMRVKVLEACAMGKAIVTSALGVQGFALGKGENFLVADAPEEFALATLQLLENPYSRYQMGMNARQMVRQKYDWQVIGPQFLELVESRDA
jgi:glycosyltransferase involved in cell wall biosynthesis